MDIERSDPDTVVVQLSYDEALVLSDLLDRWQRAGFDAGLDTAHAADRQVLNDLCASFEPVIDEVFASNYDEVIHAARLRIAPDTTAQ